MSLSFNVLLRLDCMNWLLIESKGAARRRDSGFQIQKNDYSLINHHYNFLHILLLLRIYDNYSIMTERLN